MIGAIQMDNDVLHEIAPLLTPEDFYRDAHQIAYRAILDMYHQAKRIDGITLADELTRRGQFHKIGGDDFLADMQSNLAHAADAIWHASIVKQLSTVRRIIQTSTELINAAYSQRFTAPELLSHAEKSILAIAGESSQSSTARIDAIMDQTLQSIARAKAGEVMGLLTGFVDLDGYLMGMKPGQLIVMAARPGCGKTALACNIAMNLASATKLYNSVLFVSLEMSGEELGHRWIASDAKIDSRRLIDESVFLPEESINIKKAAAKIRESRLYVDDQAGQSLLRISANARRWKQRDSLSLLVVDYLGKIQEPSNRNENTVDVLTRISGGLKNLAKELNIPILALHQLNRNSENENREPRMSDLRGSGSIEQDADVVILLHSLMGHKLEGEVKVIVAKNRSGPMGAFNMFFNKPFNRFDSIAQYGQQQDHPPEPPLQDFGDHDYQYSQEPF